MTPKEKYQKAISSMIEDCSGWDSENKALIEAFDRGRDYQKKLGYKE